MTADAVAFISYAHDDGEQFARNLRNRLIAEQPEITLWRDHDRMEGGADWWLQIREALENVSFMILIMSPAAMKSAVVRREWRYARRQGVCVVPVKTDLQQNFSTVPSWMRSKHFFDLDKEWERFCLQLKSPCHDVRVPFMADAPPQNFVPRTAVLDTLLAGLLDSGRENPKAGTVALCGAGGFGKTTLAKALCHDEAIDAAFDGGVLWATLGEKPNLKRELTKMYAALTGTQPDFLDADQAASNLSDQLADRRCLIVVDDVWEPAHLQPFLRGGKSCARLITTRDLDIASMGGARVPAEQMESSEGDAVLSWRLDDAPGLKAAVRAVVESLGAWPLLLELANAAMRLRVQQGSTTAGALEYVRQALKRRGVLAFDRRNATQRNEAIGNTIAVSLELLIPAEQQHYFALGIFPEDSAVPTSSVRTLWGMDEFDAEELLSRLGQLSLLQFDAGTKIMRMHDAMRAYLEGRLQNAPDLHARLANGWTTFARLETEYAKTHAVHHLAQSLSVRDRNQLHTRARQLAQLLADEQFQEHQRRHGNPSSTQRDLTLAVQAAVSDLDDSAPALVAAIGTALVSLPRAQLDPARLFELAAAGNLNAAVTLLSLINTDAEWRDISALTLSWLATGREPLEAGALREEIAARADGVLLQQLLGRMAGVPGEPLPAPPPLPMVEAILDRIGGGSGRFAGAELSLSHELLDGDAWSGYLADMDAPALVAFAFQNPGANTKYLKQYIAFHGGNSYVYYRRRSLAVIVRWVLRVPDVAWVKDILVDVVIAALGSSGLDFHECLPVAVAAVRARRGDTEAAANLDAYRNSVENAVQALKSRRGNSDPWSFLLRRLSALAEVYAIVLNRAADAEAMLAQASGLPSGFAGFRVKACLALAETIRMCGSAAVSTGAALDAALAAAHNIQDPTFSARMTAQVNAMSMRWHGRTFDPDTLASALGHDPASPELCAVHVIGETYRLRDSIHSIPMQESLRHAYSLRQVAEIYECDETKLLTVNAGKGLDDVLPAGTSVNVPMPQLAPLLAARCAAEALISPAVLARDRATLIQRLAPVAVDDPTTLDMVLGRMIMAADADFAEFPKGFLRLQPDLDRVAAEMSHASLSVRTSPT